MLLIKIVDMIFVKPDYLEATISLMYREHGRHGDYLSGALGLDARTLSALRSRLT